MGNASALAGFLLLLGVATTPAAKPMTLDQIAAQKQGGHAWGEIFQTMRDQGLVQEKNLGQVVSKYQRPSAAATAASAAKGK